MSKNSFSSFGYQQHPQPLLLLPQQQHINIITMIIQMQSPPKPKPLLHPHPQPLFSCINFPSLQIGKQYEFRNQQHPLLQPQLLPQLQKSSKNRIMNQSISLLQDEQQFPILSTSYIDFVLFFRMVYSIRKQKKCYKLKIQVITY